MSEDDLHRNLRRNIKVALALREMTRRQLADLIGVSESTLSQKMIGARRFTVTETLRICEVLTITPDVLISEIATPLMQTGSFPGSDPSGTGADLGLRLSRASVFPLAFLRAA